MKKQSGVRAKTFFTGLILLLFFSIATIGIYKILFSQTHMATKNDLKKLAPYIHTMIGQTALASPSATLHVPILLYHYVEYVQNKLDTTRQKLDIDPATFESQIQTLLANGYTFMTAKELGEVIDGKRQLPVRPILLTFDDGHWDFATVVLPILEKYHVKATAYIISGFIGGSDFMSQKQLQEVVDSHLVDVGAHTVHHVPLKGKLFFAAQDEVDTSKVTLEKEYHISVVSFAYPNGSFDQQAISIVKDAGFTTAVSTIPGVMQGEQNRFFLYRIRPGYMIGRALLTLLERNNYKM